MDETLTIKNVDTKDAVERCFPVMSKLRPHLEPKGFVEQVLRQMSEGGYALLLADVNGIVAGVAGYRLLENLAWGRFLYIDDLVTDEKWRSQGVGAALFDYLVEAARENNCSQLHLDSGVQRHGAHRFYLSKRMDITSHHFAMKL
jgi:GNAT superfamily N-acetyltransferase